MGAKLTKGAELHVSADDVATILTEHFCGYGPLDGLEVVAVNQDQNNGDFDIDLGVKPKPPAPPKEKA